MEIENQFQVRISDQEAASMATVGDIHAWLCQRLYPQESSPTETASGEEIWVRLQQLVSDQLDVPLSDVRRDAHIAYDLGAD